jgi:O-antigen/teichoic acid export membrane protein
MAAAWFAQPFFRRPRLDLKPVRPLLGFGLKVSVIQGVNLLRELGFVGILAAVGGAPMAGFYSMSKRLFSFPIALSSAVFRVSFPTLSRDAAARPARAARVAVYTAIAAGLPLALVAGAAQPLIRVVLGSEWDPTADIVIAGSLGMLLTASLNATMISYTLADGKAGPAIGAAVVEAAIMFGMAATLTDAWGETGVGLMLTISTLAGTGILIFQAHAVVRDSLASVAKTSAIAAVATVAAQLLDPPDDVGGLVLSLAVVTVVWTVLEMVFARADLRRMIGLARPMFSRGRSG